MNPRKFLPSAFGLLSLAAVALAISAAHAATVIYEQSFTPGADTSSLNGTSPTTGANNWVATPAFEADGDITEQSFGGSATLSLTPVNGLIYTLDASFRNMNGTANAANPEQDWIALGFAKGEATVSSNNSRFTAGDVIGKAWMLFRGDDSATVNNVAWLGSSTSGTPSGGNALWSNTTLAATYGGGMDMRVVLDTTDGTGNWTATWFAKLPASGTFTEVRAATNLVNEDIDSVGVAISGTGIDGDLTYFRLTSIPEPSAALLGGLGLLALLRRRR